MTHAQRYKLAEAKAARRLRQIQHEVDPSDLSGELALLRYLVEDATNAGNKKLASDLLTCLSRVSEKFEQSQIRQEEWVPRSVMMQICRQVVQCIGNAFSDVPDCGERMERALKEIDSIIENKNENVLQKKITAQ